LNAWIVIPTYNEAENLERIVRTLLELPLPEVPTLATRTISGVAEAAGSVNVTNGAVRRPLDGPAAALLPHADDISVLIVDDASPDGTGNIADRLADTTPDRVHVVHRAGKLGLGSAYVAGFNYALAHEADVVVQMDADFSHSPQYLPTMIGMLTDFDVVVGSRWASGGSLDPKWERWRYLLSKSANRYARWVTGLRVHDATAGFKAFRAGALRRLPLDRVRSGGYAFQVEMAVACQRQGLRVAELPIYFEERELGRSKMSLRIILEAMWRVWQIRISS